MAAILEKYLPIFRALAYPVKQLDELGSERLRRVDDNNLDHIYEDAMRTIRTIWQENDGQYLPLFDVLRRHAKKIEANYGMDTFQAGGINAYINSLERWEPTTRLEEGFISDLNLELLKTYKEDRAAAGNPDEQSFIWGADVSNLRGLNIFLSGGDVSSRMPGQINATGMELADKVLGEVTKIFREEFAKIKIDSGNKKAVAQLYREGGDEFCAIVSGIPEALVKSANDNIQKRVSDLSEALGLKNIMHAKYKDDPSKRGFNVSCAYMPIDPSMTIEAMKHHVEKVVDSQKSRRKDDKEISELTGDTGANAPQYARRLKELNIRAGVKVVSEGCPVETQMQEALVSTTSSRISALVEGTIYRSENKDQHVVFSSQKVDRLFYPPKPFRLSAEFKDIAKYDIGRIENLALEKKWYNAKEFAVLKDRFGEDVPALLEEMFGRGFNQSNQPGAEFYRDLRNFYLSPERWRAIRFEEVCSNLKFNDGALQYAKRIFDICEAKDVITGYSRESFLPVIDNALEHLQSLEANENTSPAGNQTYIMVVETQNFSGMNGTYGHQKADEVLGGFAACINEAATGVNKGVREREESNALHVKAYRPGAKGDRIYLTVTTNDTDNLVEFVSRIHDATSAYIDATGAVADGGLKDLPNPRRNEPHNKGVRVVMGVAQITPSSNAKMVLDAIDRDIEKNKVAVTERNERTEHGVTFDGHSIGRGSVRIGYNDVARKHAAMAERSNGAGGWVARGA